MAFFRHRPVTEGGRVTTRRTAFRERAGAGARAGAWGVARIVQTIAGILAAILVLGIVLVLLEANRSNGVVEAMLDAARWLAGPFDDMFKPDDARARVAINWGIAALVIWMIGALIARLLRR